MSRELKRLSRLSALSDERNLIEKKMTENDICGGLAIESENSEARISNLRSGFG